MPKRFFDGDVLKRRLLRGVKAAGGIAVFLDYDGTLVPIQRDPSRCSMAVGLKQQLRALSECRSVRMAVLSGRSLSDIRRRVGVRGIYYGGNHGLDISGPGIRFTPGEAKSARPLIARAKRMLGPRLRSIEGAWLEDKKYTLSLHFRAVNAGDVTAVRRIFYEGLKELPGRCLSVIRGKKVLELAPSLEWDKGKAALLILDQLGGDCLPVVIGDDLTDETMFEALKGRGITVRVGRSRKTSAQYFINNQGEVSLVLERLLSAVRA